MIWNTSAHSSARAGSRTAASDPITSRWRTKRGIALASVFGTLVVAAFASSAPTAALAATPSFPSWGAVVAANRSVAAKQAEVNQLKALITKLDAQVTATQAVAKTKGDAYGTAEDAYYAAGVQAQTYQQQATAAKALGKKSRAQAGQLAAQLARSGASGFQLNLFFNGKNATKVLSGIGDGGRVSARASGIYKQALQDQKSAKSLQDQADVAKAIRNNLKVVAQAAYEVAQSAATDAQTALDAQNAHKTELQAQLASLTTNAKMTQAGYLAGLKALGITGSVSTEISSSGWALPTLGHITSGFGMRVNPFNGAYQLHDGTDMARGCGQPIYAGHAGTVDYAGWYGALGEFVRIRNDSTYETGYGHIAAGKILVHEGQQIQVGQLIARTGETGTATGCHLHYMVIIDSVPVNPVPFMRGKGIVLGQV
jgi:murein DD-endopeptidase MepM/ murein hydrolase activator NlpD